MNEHCTTQQVPGCANKAAAVCTTFQHYELWVVYKSHEIEFPQSCVVFLGSNVYSEVFGVEG